jgi:hypothetical protein
VSTTARTVTLAQFNEALAALHGAPAPTEMQLHLADLANPTEPPPRPITNVERYMHQPRRWALDPRYRLCAASRALLEVAVPDDPPMPVDADTPIPPTPMPAPGTTPALVVETLAGGEVLTVQQLAEITGRSLSAVHQATKALADSGALVRVSVPCAKRPNAGALAHRLRTVGDG